MAGNIVGFFDGGKPGCGCDQLQGRLCYVWIYLALYCNCLWLFLYRRKRLMGGLVEFSTEYAWVQKQLLSEMRCHMR